MVMKKNNKTKTPLKTTTTPLDTRGKILQAAIDVFFERGFVQASLEEIATKAHATRGAVYWHFNNKHDIFEALHEKLCQPLTSSILEDMNKNCDDSLHQLEKLCIKLLVDLDDDDNRKKILTIFLCKCDYSQGMEEILEKQRKQKLKNIDLFSRYFERAKQRKFLSRNVDAKTAAISLACYMSGIVIEHLRNPKLFNLKKHAPLLISQFFAAFKS